MEFRNKSMKKIKMGINNNNHRHHNRLINKMIFHKNMKVLKSKKIKKPSIFWIQIKNKNNKLILIKEVNKEKV